jgi:predicted site-specific integrase-resolvase
MPLPRTITPIVVYPLREWCKMRHVSLATANRLAKSGKLKITHLSERRRGVRSDHDLEYLDANVREPV